MMPQWFDAKNVEGGDGRRRRRRRRDNDDSDVFVVNVC